MSDININLPEAAKNLADPVKKLIETIADGIGMVYEPTHIKRMAKAKAQEIQTIAAALRDNEDIPICYANGVVNADTTNANDIASRTAMRLGVQEIRKQQNIEEVVAFAKDELMDSVTVAAEAVDPDWTARFMNSVEDIGDEEMQKLWGKILAGEIKKPSSFSLRTLECVKNLSQKEAQLFCKVAQYFVCVGNDIFLPREDDLLKKINISLREILKLEDCGLIVPSSSLTLTFKIEGKDDNNNPYITNGADTIVVFSTNDQSQVAEIVFNQYDLTIAGRELYKVLHITNSREYLMLYAQFLKEKTMPRPPKINVYEVIERNVDGRISYQEKDLLDAA